jgi:hypothetical protein
MPDVPHELSLPDLIATWNSNNSIIRRSLPNIYKHRSTAKATIIHKLVDQAANATVMLS